VRRAGGLLDWDGILGMATDGFPRGTELDAARADFAREFGEKVRHTGGLANQVAAVIKQGGDYRLLGVESIGGQPRARFRLLLPDSAGFNYQLLTFYRDESGEVRIRDVYDTLTGEFLSQTLRRAFLPFLAKAGVSGLGSSDVLALKHADDLTRLAELVTQQQFAESLQLLHNLPANLQTRKHLLLIRVQAAQWVSNAEYDAALAEFTRQYPDDASAHLLSLDGLVLNERFDLALAVVEKIDRLIGGDPYLHVVRAGIHYQAGRSPEAEDAARRAIAAEPTLEDAYWQITTISLDSREFDTTREMLTLLRDRLKVELQDLTQVPEYAEFVKSPQYRQWLAEKNVTRERR
jgi:tetratricopeptide (TPR) repeat protein